MRNTLSNSWALAAASIRVLNTDRALLLFPLLSGLASIGIMASFLFPVLVLGGPERLFSQAPLAGAALAFLFYLVQYFVVFYFNAALVSAALIHLDGGRPTLQDGLRIASDHAVPILGYAALSATVGVLLNSVGRKSGIGGRVVSGALGIGWSLAAFLVIPVLVTRNVGPIDAVKQSAGLLRSTWGEQVSGRVGMGIVFGVGGAVLGLLSIGVIVGGAALGPLALVPTVIGLVLLWVFYALVTTAVQGIYQAAVYRYAVTGAGGHGFEAIPLGEVVHARSRG